MNRIFKVALVMWVTTVSLLLPAVSHAQILRAFTQPVRVSEVAASEPGIVQVVYVHEGDEVRQGDRLAALDKEVIEQTLEAARAKAESTARVDAAKAMLEIRQQQHNKLLDLDDQGHGNKFEVERAKAELNSAEAEYRLAVEARRLAMIEIKRIEAQLERRVIRSPFDGVVTRIHKEVGEYVSGSEPQIMTVVKLNQLRATFHLKAKQLERLSKGSAVRVSLVQAHQTIPLKAIVEFIAPVVEPKSGTAQVSVIIDNSQRELISGNECIWSEDDGSP